MDAIIIPAIDICLYGNTEYSIRITEWSECDGLVEISYRNNTDGKIYAVLPTLDRENWEVVKKSVDAVFDIVENK